MAECGCDAGDKNRRELEKAIEEFEAEGKVQYDRAMAQEFAEFEREAQRQLDEADRRHVRAYLRRARRGSQLSRVRQYYQRQPRRF